MVVTGGDRHTAARAGIGPSPSDFLHLLDRAIASTRSRSPSIHRCGLGRGNHDVRATRTRGIVEGDRVAGRVRRDAGDVAFDRIDQSDGRRRVSEIALSQGRRRRSPPIGRHPDGASCSLVYRVVRVSRRPIHLRPRSRVPHCQRRDAHARGHSTAAWWQASGYHRQARVENAFFRYKSIIGR